MPPPETSTVPTKSLPKSKRAHRPAGYVHQSKNGHPIRKPGSGGRLTLVDGRWTQKAVYSPELATELLERIADGETLTEVCRDPWFPAVAAVLEWVEKRPDFAEGFTRARQQGFHAIAENVLTIADDGRNDWMEKETPRGDKYTVLNREHVERSKIRCDMRLRLLAKWDAKHYGDKIALTAGDGTSPPTFVFEVASKAPQQLAVLDSQPIGKEKE